jgi:hypothetical protein
MHFDDFLRKEINNTQIVLSVFRPRGVLGPTSKIVVACPSPDGLARDGTQGGKRGSCYPAPGGCACSRGYKCLSAHPPARPILQGENVACVIHREGERESEPARQPILPCDPPRMRALDLPFIDARRGSRCTMGCSYALTCPAERCLSPVYMPTWLSERC